MTELRSWRVKWSWALHNYMQMAASAFVGWVIGTVVLFYKSSFYTDDPEGGGGGGV